MEIDTGACVSLIPYTVYQRHFSNLKLCKSGVNLCSFTGRVCRQSAGDSETFWTDEEVVVACVEGFTFHTVGQGLAKGAACGLAVNQKCFKIPG